VLLLIPKKPDSIHKIIAPMPFFEDRAYYFFNFELSNDSYQKYSSTILLQNKNQGLIPDYK